MTDLLGVDVDVVADPDVSVRGAAIIAARSTGDDLPAVEAIRTFTPDTSRSSRAREVIDALSSRFAASA